MCVCNTILGPVERRYLIDESSISYSGFQELRKPRQRFGEKYVEQADDHILTLSYCSMTCAEITTADGITHSFIL